MRKMIIALLFLLPAGMLQAQAFKKGQRIVDLGIGLGSPYWGSGTKATLPINPKIGMESGISDEFSVGGSIAMSRSKYEYVYFGEKYGWTYTGYFISARGSYHFAAGDKLDPYIGATAGYVLVTVKEIGTGIGSGATALGSGAGYGGYAGVRYYVKPKLALNAELGYTSFSFLNAGVSIKL